jgi:hypothetical protein
MTKSFFVLTLTTTLICTVSLLTLTAAQAGAQEQPATSTETTEVGEQPTSPQPQVQFSPILPVKIKPRQDGADGISKAAASVAEDTNEEEKIDVETLALFVTANDGSLGKDAWKNLSRDDVRDLISASVPPTLPVLRGLYVRALLTDASLSSGSAPADGNDLFTLRLKKLVEAGAFDDAFRLYRRLGTQTPTASAAQAGIDAMIGKQQLGIACLESKALDPSLRPATTFWADVQTFCNGLLGPASGPIDLDETQRQTNAARVFLTAEKFPVPSTLKDLNPLTSIRILALARTGAFDKIAINEKTFDGVSLRVVGLLKTYSNAESVFGKAVASQWDSLTLLTESSEKSTESSQATPENAAKTSEISAAKPPETPAVAADENESQPIDSITNPQDFALAAWAAFRAKNTPLDKSVYDKIFSLTPQLDYVMPNDAIMNRLASARNDRATGAAVMVGLQILSAAPFTKLHPAAWLRVLETWTTLGMSNEAESLAQDLQKIFERKS